MSTFAAFKAYLAAAQAAFVAGEIDDARDQVLLARMELAKIPDVEGSTEKATFRNELDSIDDALKGRQAESGASTRRNSPQFATITPAATSAGDDD